MVRAAILRSPDPPLHFYASSGGNAGLAAINAAVRFGYPCTLVVPMSTKPMMIDKCRLAGATEVIQHGASWFEADVYLRERFLGSPGAVYVPPFDHPDIWDGAATMVDEIEVQLGEGSHSGAVRLPIETESKRVAPDAIVCSVGGGGLFAGVMQGVTGSTISRRSRVIAVETVGAESLHEAIKAKQLVTLPAITSIATSLGARTVCQTALDYALHEDVRSVVVTDAEAMAACCRFADDERCLVEPGCGASLSLAYNGKLGCVEGFGPATKVVIIVCGGSAITAEMIAGYRSMHDD